MIPPEERPRLNSTHTAYITRIVIPPIIIPTSPKNVYRAPQAPQEQDLPAGPKGCLIGTAKIIGGCLSFPFVCAASCLAGTGYTMYHTATCADSDIINHRNTFCLLWGCGTACNYTLSSIESGARDIKRTPQVEDMVR